MLNSLIKFKLLKLAMLSAVAGGIAAGAVASVVAKEMCKKNKKTSEEKPYSPEGLRDPPLSEVRKLNILKQKSVS